MKHRPDHEGLTAFRSCHSCRSVDAARKLEESLQIRVPSWEWQPSSSSHLALSYNLQVGRGGKWKPEWKKELCVWRSDLQVGLVVFKIGILVFESVI